MEVEQIKRDCIHIKEGKCRIYLSEPKGCQCSRCYAYKAVWKDGQTVECRRRTDGTPTDGTPTDGTPTDGTPTDGTPTA